MIWNKNLLYPINDVWYHIKKLYVLNNEKKYKIEQIIFYKRHPTIPQGEVCVFYLRKKTWTMFLSSYTNTSGSFRGREMLWEHKPQASVSTGECFHSFFKFSQTSTSVCITR